MFGVPVGGYNSCLSFLKSAISESEEHECCNLLLTRGNTDSTSLSYKFKSGEFGYPCFPVNAGLFRIKDGEIWHKSVILYRPVGIKLFEVSDEQGSERYVVNAELLGCASSPPKQGYEYLEWLIPMSATMFLRGAYTDVSRSLERVDAASCSGVGESMYAFEFGQKYGDSAIELKRAGSFRFSDSKEEAKELLRRAFIVKDLENESKLVTLLALFGFVEKMKDSYINNWAEEHSNDVATLLECFGEHQYSLFSRSKFCGFTGVYPIALSMSKDGSPEIVCISAKPSKGSNLHYSVVKRKLFSEIEKEDNSKVDNMTFLSGGDIRLTLIDRTIILERTTLNNLLGCGVTTQSQKGAAAAVLSGIGRFTIWGDGSLRSVELTGTSLRIPATVTSIAKEALGNVAYANGSALTDIIIPASVEKIDKKAFFHHEEKYVKSAQMDKIFAAPIYFARIDDDVVEQLYKALVGMLDTSFYSSMCPVFAFKEDDHSYNRDLLLSLIKAASTTRTPYIFTKRNTRGASDRMEIEDVKKYFTVEDLRHIIRSLVCNELLVVFDRTKKITVSSSDKFRKDSTYENFESMSAVPKWGRGYQMLSNLTILWNVFFNEIFKDSEDALKEVCSLYLEAIKAYRLCYKVLRDYASSIQGVSYVDSRTPDVERLLFTFEKKIKEAKGV